jgi:hypothetical protein
MVTGRETRVISQREKSFKLRVLSFHLSITTSDSGWRKGSFTGPCSGNESKYCLYSSFA